MTVEIVEIIRRSDQGVTKPFVCRGDDDEVYFVKGVGAGRGSQFKEWIAGNLALAMGLPIAPFSLVNIPEELLSLDYEGKYADLGAGVAFGSCKQTVTEFHFSVLGDVPLQTKRDLLVFDWWVLNEDRKYTERGGNPNLFWKPDEKELVVIDHNQAFDEAFSKKDFLDLHVFKDEVPAIRDDLLYRDEYNQRFAEALQPWDGIIAQIPDCWYFADKERTVPAKFSSELALEMLNRYTRDDFWTWL